MSTLEVTAVKRKCSIQGRDGQQFALLRKNTINSLVRPIDQNNQFCGPEEHVDTNAIYNERVLARPAKPPKGEQEYPADRPLRRICLLKGQSDDVQYHLIRKSADHSKILRVGEAGVGEWVLNSQIREEFTQPVPVKVRTVARQPVRICEVEGRPGERYLLLRKTSKMARVIGPITGDNFGETLDPSLILNEQKTSRRKASEAVTGAQADQGAGQDGQETGHDGQETGQDGQETVVTQPVQQAPVQQAPVQQAPVQQAPVQQAPVQQAPVQQAPRPQQAPVQPGQPAQRPQQPGQPAQRPQQAGQPAPRPQQTGQPVQARPVQQPPIRQQPQTVPPRPVGGR